MSDQLEQWAYDFRERYHKQVETRIKRTHEQLRKKTGRIIRNINIENSDYSNIHRLLAFMRHLRTCLHRSKQDDIKWYKDYLKTCIEQVYSVVDYPDADAWNKFFATHNQKQVFNEVKGYFLEKLSKY